MIFVVSIVFVNCKKDKTVVQEFQKIEINKNIVSDSLIENFKKSGVNNTILGIQTISFGFPNDEVSNRDYVCNAFIGEKDTLNVWLNNYNGNFGNGILLKIIDNQFFVKSISPNVKKGIQFEKFQIINQNLVLNKKNYAINDKISGYIFFECIADSTKHKKIEGYFQTKIYRY